MRILIVSAEIPFPPYSGGRLRTYHLLRALAARHALTLVGFTYGETTAPPPFPLRVIEVPWEQPALYSQMQDDDAAVSARAFEKLADPHGEPWLASALESCRMAEVLERLSEEPFDRILLQGSGMGRFLPSLPAYSPKILNLFDVHSRMAQREIEGKTDAEKESARCEAARIRRFEQWVAGACELCLAVSEPEAEAAKRLLKAERVHIVPNGVDTAYFTPGGAPVQRGALLFTGKMNYRPNVEAVQFFSKEVLPLIQQERPDVQFHIVGDSPEAAVRSLAAPDVIVHGRVPDMRPYHRRAQVVVAPLLRGGGTRLKILEAAASGKAIVTTALGMEGLAFHPGEDLLVADSPSDFARAVIELLHEDSRIQSLGQCARQAALAYDWIRIGELACRAVENLF